MRNSQDSRGQSLVIRFCRFARRATHFIRGRVRAQPFPRKKARSEHWALTPPLRRFPEYQYLGQTPKHKAAGRIRSRVQGHGGTPGGLVVMSLAPRQASFFAAHQERTAARDRAWPRFQPWDLARGNSVAKLCGCHSRPFRAYFLVTRDLPPAGRSPDVSQDLRRLGPPRYCRSSGAESGRNPRPAHRAFVYHVLR